MSPITHAILPLLIARSRISKRPDGAPSWRVSALVALSGVLPDLLSPHLGLEERHAAFSHSLPAWSLFSFALVAAGLHPALRRHRGVAAICAGAYLLHLGCDFITGGVPLFSPFIPGAQGDAWLPFWSWFVLDGLMLAYAYGIYRWLPLRRKIIRASASAFASGETV